MRRLRDDNLCRCSVAFSRRRVGAGSHWITSWLCDVEIKTQWVNYRSEGKLNNQITQLLKSQTDIYLIPWYLFTLCYNSNNPRQKKSIAQEKWFAIMNCLVGGSVFGGVGEGERPQHGRVPAIRRRRNHVVHRSFTEGNPSESAHLPRWGVLAGWARGEPTNSHYSATVPRFVKTGSEKSGMDSIKYSIPSHLFVSLASKEGGILCSMRSLI